MFEAFVIKAAAYDDVFALRLICVVSLPSSVAYTIEEDVISAAFSPHSLSVLHEAVGPEFKIGPVGIKYQ